MWPQLPPYDPARVERELADLNARVETLEKEMEKVRQRMHDLPSQVFVPVQNELLAMRESISTMTTLLRRRNRVEKQEDGENRKITMRDFYVSSGSVTITILILKFLKIL